MVNRIILFTSFLIVISCAKRVNRLDLVDSTNNVANFSFTDSVFIPDYNQYLCFNNQGLVDTTYSYVEYTFCSDPDLRNLQRFSHHTYACEDTVGLGYDFISDDSIQLIDFYSYRSENNELLDSHYLQTQKERFITTKKAQGNTSSQQLYCELRTSCGITYFYSTTPSSLLGEKKYITASGVVNFPHSTISVCMILFAQDLTGKLKLFEALLESIRFHH